MIYTTQTVDGLYGNTITGTVLDTDSSGKPTVIESGGKIYERSISGSFYAE